MTLDPLGAGVRFGQFLRRMTFISVAVGLLVALLAPASYWIAARAGLNRTSSALAHDIAHDIADIAARDPHLWRYNVAKVVQATSNYGRRRDLAAVSVLECGGGTLIGAEALGFASDAPGPVAYAEIAGPGGALGFVRITADTGAVRATVWRLAAAGSVLGVLLAAGLIIVPSRVVRRQYADVARTGRELRAAQSEVEAMNAALERRVDDAVAQVRHLSEQALQVQEEERSRIARDLHDTLGQHLSAQRLELDGLTIDPAQVPERAKRLRALNDELLDDLRRAVRDLRPAALDGRSLADALAELSESFELRSGIATTTRFSGLDDVAPHLGAAVFRVAQEALTNVARHAQASEVSVRARVEAGRLLVEIHDDGVGGAVETEGHGLRFMHHRIAPMGGTVTIESQPNAGTTISVRCPAAGV